jgi:RHS repeat-associated protein
MYDHLGSIRVVVNEAGDIVSSDDYYPWGMIMDGRSTDNNYHNAKYKFTGKERDKETGYDYFGARYYDSRIGRWLAIDPMLEKHPEWSPYNYVLNNPLKLIDPNGKQILVSDPFFSYGFSKGFLGTLESSVTGLYGTVTHPLATGERTWQAIIHPGATLEAMGSAVGNWAGRLTSANPIESGEAFGEATAFIGETLIGMKGISKISSLSKFSELSELSTVRKLMSGVEKFTSGQLKMFERQLTERGIKSLLKSRSTFEWRLSKHLKDLKIYKETGGFTSKTETEIRNFQQQINAINEILKREIK